MNNKNQNNIMRLLKYKLAMLGGGIFLLVLLFIANMSSAPTQEPISGDAPNQIPAEDDQEQIDPVVYPTMSMEQTEQAEADAGFAEWEENVNTAYPWYKKTPIRTEKYFVYFDLNKKVFVGLLYPKEEDVEPIKADIKNQLKDVKEIPIENYPFEWTTILQ